MTDADGNVYNTLQIGGPCWLKENLRTAKYRNGIAIDYPGSNNGAWTANGSGAYAWHENNAMWKDSYGALNNQFAVNSSNGLCQAGWHVPAKDEWLQLLDYVIYNVHNNYDTPSGAGNALKSCR